MDTISIPRDLAQKYLDENLSGMAVDRTILAIRAAIRDALAAPGPSVRVIEVPPLAAVSATFAPAYPDPAQARVAAFLDREGKLVVLMNGAEQKNLVEFSMLARGVETRVDAKFAHVAGSKG